MPQLSLRPRGRGAPFACTASVSTGGSGWPSGTVSFLIVAWYSASEHDFTTCVPCNWAWRYAGASLSETRVQETALYNLSAAPGSSFTFTWSRPAGRQPDHYSIYWMPGPTFALLASAPKVLPSSGLVNGNIPGSATSALITLGTARTEALQMPVLSTHATGIAIPGNRAMSFGPGGSVVLAGVSGIADGAYTVLAASADWTCDGPVTQLDLAGVSGVTPAAQTGTCSYDCGPICLRLTATGGYRPQCFISLEHELALTCASTCAPDFCGQPAQQSLAQPWQCLSFDLAYGGLSPGSGGSLAPGGEPGALARLNTWARLGTELELVDEAGWSSSTDYVCPALIRYFGTLDLPSNPGTAHRWGDSYRFGLQLSGVKRTDDERGWHSVRAVATGAGGTFDVDGNQTALYIPGAGFHVFGSTGNDGPYCVAVSSYSAATNRTSIAVTGSVASAVADGHLEVQEW